MDAYIMALDQGTTSSRSIIFNARGKAVSTAQYTFEQIYPRPGWVEHDPNEILKTQFKSMKEALNKSQIQIGDIAGIGVTNQRETVVVWEKATGKPIYNAIVWQCRRTAEMCDQIVADGMSEEIRNKTGLLADAYFSGTKIKWILDNVPGVRSKAEKGEILCGTIESWLIWNLTGGKSHITDFSNASRTMLFDIQNLKWDADLCKYLDIPMCMLPTPWPNSIKYGLVAEGIKGLEEFAGIPICGCAGDQFAALFGQGCFNQGQAKNTYGTGCFTLMNVGPSMYIPKNPILTSVCWSIGGKTTYALEGSVFNGATTIEWIKDELGIVSSARECDELAESVPNSNDVYIVPAFTGLGAPFWDMYARGTIVGITRGVTKAHISRAVLESISFQVKALIDLMDKESSGITELKVDGGVSRSNIMLQMQSDMIRRPVDRPKNIETTATGAAYLAGLCAGVWNSTDELSKIRETDRIFTPKMDAAIAEKHYNNWLKAVERSRNWANEAEPIC